MKNNECITISHLSKTFKTGFFKKKKAVDDLSLTVPSGQVVGLLGPNGSGKSTTIKMIMGFLRPNAGEILICGHPADSKIARNFVGYLPENPRFQKFLTGRDILRYYGRLLELSGLELEKRMDLLLELVSLKHAADERVHGYSKGMTQRLAIAQSMLKNPPLLIFDEPMSGLDPLGRLEIRKLIRTIHEENPESTLFFSSHVLEDVEELCAHVALLQKGKLKTFCTIESLIEGEEKRFDITLKNIPQPLETELFSGTKALNTAVGLNYSVQGVDKLSQTLSRLVKEGVEILRVSSHRKKLEEALFRENEGLPVLDAKI